MQPTLSLVSEEDLADDDFYRAGYAERAPQSQRGEAPHLWTDPRRAIPPRPAAPVLFPTEQILGALGAIGAVLGARLALFLGGLGVYLLGVQAAEGGSIWPMVTFGGLVVLPTVWLSARRNI